MSIREVTYKLCKSVQNSANREKIRNLVLAISVNNDAIVFRQTVRALFRYPKIQFLAYLIVNQHRDEKDEKVTHSFPSLDQDEINLLINCHEQLVKLNKLCVEPFLNIIPEAELAVNPFNKAIVNNLYNQQEFDEEFELYDSNVADELVSIFHKHPAIEAILKSLHNAKEDIEKDHYLKDVLDISEEFVNIPPFESPEWIKDKKKINENEHLVKMLALVCIRDSLINMNQLIFQAATDIDNKLLIFDENIVLNLSATYNSAISSALRVTSLQNPLKFMMGVEPLIFNSGALVLLKDIYGYEGIQLGRVEGHNSDLFSDFAEFDIRLIDENLNSFPFAVKNENWKY